MRICMLARSTPEHAIGGMERVTGELANAWSDAGHRVTLITTPSPEVPLPWQWAGVEVVPLPGESGRYSDSWGKIAARCDYSDFDIILGVSAAARELLRAPYRKVPLVMQAHGTSLDEIKTKWESLAMLDRVKSLKNIFWLARDMCDYPRYDQVIGVGPAIAHSLHRLPRQAQPRNYITIPNGIDIHTVPEVQKSARSGVIFVGRLRQEKGADLVIRAIAQGTETLTIVGDGPEREPLERLAETLGVSDRVRFVGQLTKNQVFAELSSAQVLVAPSRRYEVGLPLTVLEALACHTPVVVSAKNAGTMDDDLAGSVTASSLTPEDLAKAISHASQRIATLPTTYTLSESAAQYLRTFERLIEGKHTADESARS